ncbi:MAG: thiamine pyrophosphate-dependent dehydrogenase E1 component subunit alpha, partial [Candidatus Dormibacteraeota bacterium]|nr:thiamine pyrophosphate-dependent dehydrogenase E1 component subunit alpha [Candidatus Dormibacteraeota bacterium]
MVGEQETGTAFDAERAYRVISLGRHLDETMWRLARAGRAHFAVPCSGHEAIGAGYALALRTGFDFMATHYRDLTAVLAAGVAPREVMLHFFAKRDDPFTHGRQPYAHWGSRQRRIISLQGPQPNHATHAVGVAWGSRLLGEDSVTWICFGDGGAQKGEVHEAMNFAAIHRLPCVFCVETNGLTQSVPIDLESALPTLAARAAGYGMPGETVDGTDVRAVWEAARAAIDRARRGGGPSLIEATCRRFLGNTSNDDDSRYRSPEEREEARRHDPLLNARELLPASLADAIDEESSTTAREAAEWAEAQPDGDPAEVL